jgi:hypothetical protein
MAESSVDITLANWRNAQKRIVCVYAFRQQTPMSGQED